MNRPIQLGELLFHEGLVTIEQLEDAHAFQKKNGGRLVDALLALDIVADGEISGVLERWYGFPAVDLDDLTIDPAVLDLVPAELAIKYGVLPVARSGATLYIVLLDPTDGFTLHRLRFRVPYAVKVLVARESAIREAIRGAYGRAPVAPEGCASVPRVVRKNRVNPAEPREVQDLCDEILSAALRPGTREIHIAPSAGELQVHFFEEEDTLREIMRLPLCFREEIVHQVKKRAELDVRERWRPQRGRLSVSSEADGREVVLRVFTYPTRFGEKVVARLLA